MAKVVEMLVVLVLMAAAVQGQLEDFLMAFPNANITALYELPEEAFHNLPVDPIPVASFSCPSIPAPADTNNVKNLRPGNIKVVMAMGDSITAAMSAKDTSILSLKEYRGLSYSIGGDSGVTTFPNLLKTFSPNIVGSSTGIGKRTSAGTGFNAAVSGAINKDMIGQAQWLVQQLKASSKVNMATDWKVLTLWIGSNNLCDICDNEPNNNAANYEAQVTEALEYLYANVPRLFVNLVANLEISTLYDVRSGFCGMLHSVACGCVGTSNTKDRALVKSTGLQYQALASKIAANFNARNNPEFAVVVQPFLTTTIINDRKELSAADCFHPSASSHGVAAIALWNNMLTPAANKKTNWTPTDTPICPTADSLFYTN